MIALTCSSPVLWGILSAVKKVLLLLQIAGPILLIIALALHFTKLMSSPEDKKIPKKIVNSIIAAVLLFFIPLFVNIVMSLMGENMDVSACWNSADKPTNSSSYQETNSNTRQKIYNDSNSYQGGSN